jgi:hypothetical protein
MRRFIECFMRCFGNNLKNEITNEMKSDLAQIKDILNSTVSNQIDISLKSQSNIVRKALEKQLIRDLQQIEFQIVSQITTKLTENIQNVEENLRDIANEILEKHKRDFERRVKELTLDTLSETRTSYSLFGEIGEQLQELQQEELKTSSDDLVIIQPLEVEFESNTEKYKASYNNSDEYFWGIGIENETYLEGSPINLKGETIVNYLGRERYSVDYTKNYNINDIQEKIRFVYKPDESYNIFRMINSHSFTKIDINGNHKTTYEREPKSNLYFDGSSVLDRWFAYDPQIKKKLDPESKDKTNIFFDGDTIEFITENFYKTNTQECCRELIERRDWFLNRLNEFKKANNLWDDLGELKFVEKHPGLNIFRTQMDKIVLFNNTTLHFHITLPTPVKNGIIIDENKFIEIHSNAIKALQWFEPFFIATLGSPDIFQNIYEKYYGTNDKIYYSSGSMRATISRYIGIGTYDTEIMPKGKILTIDTFNEPTWRNRVAKEMLYKLPENLIGLDFNFNKHYQSGLEFRVLDGIPMNILKDVLDVIILICEYSLDSPNIPIAKNSNLWNELVYLSMAKGYKSTINHNQILDFLNTLGLTLELNIDTLALEDFYYLVLEELFKKYRSDSKIIYLMTRDFNGINRWENFNKIQSLNHLDSLNTID